jgi:Na+/H+-translocating membrane pyrophosphatase
LDALRMLSNLSISLTIDSYGHISDNARDIELISELGELIR